MRNTFVKITAVAMAAAMGVGIMAGCNKSLTDTGYSFNSGGELTQVSLARLPVGSIRAKGHLYERLEAQADNITYDMYEIDKDLYNSLIFGNGTHTGVPSAAYYIRGLAYTAYTLGPDDPAGAKCIERTEQLLENMYAYAEEYKDDPNYSGLYVPPSAQNWVDKQEVGEALQYAYEATGNEKALELLENYYVWLVKDLKQNSMAANWEGARKADIMDSGVWLYNQTQKPEIKATVLEALQLVSEQSIDWEDIMTKNEFTHYNFYTRHIVNVTQGMKEPVENYLLTGSEESLQAFYTGLENLTRDHGRVDGLINGSEQLSGRSSIEAVETCGVVEMIKSLDRAFQVTADVELADRIERIGYNSLPASFSYDMKSISYFNPTNLVQIVKGEGMGYTDLYYDGNPGYCTDADEDLGLGPHPACHCCSVNCHIGYPEFINSMYYATDDNGAMIALYGPSTATLKVGKDAQEVTIAQTTNYPYEDVVNITVSGEEAGEFPLMLRIPEWATNIKIELNGEPVSGAKAGEYLTIERAWSKDDVLSIDFAPEVTESRWANNSIGVTRGSLVFSISIGEEYTQRGVAGSTQDGKTYYDYDVMPTNDWNYGLVLEEEDFADNFEVIVNTRDMTDTYNYYDHTNYENAASAPIALKVKARKIDDWTVNDNGILAEEVPMSPVVQEGEDVTIYLVPYAAGKLRVANIPEIATDGEQDVETEVYENDFTENTLLDFLFYGPAYNVTSRGFGTYYKINYGSEAINENDDANAWGHSAFNPKAVLDGRLYQDFTLETTIAAKGTAIDTYGVIFRATDISHSRHGFRGYYLAVDRAENMLCLYKTDENFEPKLVTQAKIGPISVVSGVKLKIVAQGSSIKVYANNELAIDAIDTSYTSAGQIGFVVHAFDFMLKKGEIESSSGKLDLAYAIKNVTIAPM